MSSARSRPSTPAWLHGALLGVVVVAALALRLSYLQERQQAPDFDSPIADAAFHDYWARGMATGNWTPPAGEADPRLEEVPYLRPPGYPVLLSLVYRLAGPGPFAPLVLQTVLGIANCLLAYLLGRRLFGPSVGLLAAALSGTAWASIYFEGELQAPVLIQTVSLSLMLVLHRWWVRPALPLAMAAGVLAGLLALVRANALLFIPVAAGWMLWAARRREEIPRPAPSAVAFLVAALVAILPATVRNLVVAGEPVLISANGAVNLYIGNNETSDGVTADIPDLQELTGLSGWSWFSYDRIVQGLSRNQDRDLSYTDVSRFFTGRATEWITSNPGDFLRLTMRRAFLFWGPDEISNNKAIRFEKAASRTLSRLPEFPLLLTFGLVGAVWVLRDARDRRAPDLPPFAGPGAVLLGLFALTWFASFLPFLAAARFRVPLLPILALFGAYAIVRLAGSLREGRWARAGAMTAIGAGIFLVARISTVETDADQAWWHTDRAVALERNGRTEAALAEYGRALEVSPGFVDAKIRRAQLLYRTGEVDRAVAEYHEALVERPQRFDIRLQLGELLMEESRWQEAATELALAVQVNPQVANAHFHLGRALTELGRYEEALEAYYTALSRNPGEAVTHLNLGITLGRMGRHADAVAELGRAIEIDPFTPEAHYHLGNSLQATGDVAGAEKSFEEAIRVEPKYVEAIIHLGNLLHDVGRSEEALEQYRKAIRLDPENFTAHHNLSGTLGQLGRIEEALAASEKAVEINPENPHARQRLAILQQMKAEAGSN